MSASSETTAPAARAPKRPADPPEPPALAPAVPPTRGTVQAWVVALRHCPLAAKHSRFECPASGPADAWRQYLAWLPAQLTREHYPPLTAAPGEEKKIPPTYQPLAIARNFLKGLGEKHALRPPPEAELLPRSLLEERMRVVKAKAPVREEWSKVQAEVAAVRAAYADELRE